MIGWIALLLTALLFSGCSDTPTGPANTREMRVRGITLADWTPNGYKADAFDDPARVAIDAIAAAGANTLTLVVTGYQSNLNSNEVRTDNTRTPAPRWVASAIFRAKSFGLFLDVSLKIHVDVDTGEWRGKIVPADPGAWFASYKTFLMEWALFAENNGVDQLIVGTELAGTIENQNRWRGLISDVREAFSGEIVYAASWDEAPKVPFWDAVDLVGVNFYAPVSKRETTQRMDILIEWQTWLSRIRLLHKQAGRDVMLTEIGYRSVDGAGMHPYDFERQAPVDLGEQADLYWGALQAVGDQPWIRGVYWWNWLADGSGGASNTDFTPSGKPAEGVLQDAWR